MARIDIELWHVITIIVMFFIGIYKQQISQMFNQLNIRKILKSYKGRKINILANGNDWEEVTIINIELSIPFFRTGGIRMLHHNNGKSTWFELMPFENWQKYRFKYKHEDLKKDK